MSIITLTDRISVSVRAKNETERSSQNKATGANIQKALGGSGLSDSDLESIGNVNSVTDEDGNEWIPMNDWIAAGRLMNEKGAFKNICETDPSKLGYNVPILSTCILPDTLYRQSTDSEHIEIYNNAPIYGIWFYSNYNMTSVFMASSAEFHTKLLYAWADPPTYWSNGADESTIYGPVNTKAGPVYWNSTAANYKNFSKLYTKEEFYNDIYRNGFNQVDSKLAEALVYATTSKSGGSLIDWTAPNAEIERQVKETRDTYYDRDTAQYFVLAGPIEYGSEGDAPDDNPNN